jgi:alkylated DNA repair dioxygenase AlkB
MTRLQRDFFAEAAELPPGMGYRPAVIAPEQEQALIAFIAALPLKPFEFVGGFTGNRRVMSFGWRYDYNARDLDKTAAMPPALIDVRAKVVPRFGLDAEQFQHALVTEYAPGAGIGWHRDKAVFGDVIGISLRVQCNFRLRRRLVSGWERASLHAEPRSAYLLSGPARTQWEHGIPPLSDLRYSVTFRNFAREAGRSR